MGTLGSRSLFHMGHAVRLAAEEARDKIKALARDVGEPEGSNIPLAELFKKKYGMQAGNIVGTGIYKPDYVPPDPATGLTPNVTPFWMCAAGGAEVEVDTETGQVRITRLINLVDCGRPLNPKIVETQISGGALMQLGFTMFEKMHIDAGQVTNASLADYKIPGILDVPPMENEAVGIAQANGPFGAKGVGRDLDLLRIAGDRQRDRGRLRRAAHRASAQRRGGVPRTARQRQQTARGRLMSASRTISSRSTASRSPPRSSRTTTSSSCCSANSTSPARARAAARECAAAARCWSTATPSLAVSISPLSSTAPR